MRKAGLVLSISLAVGALGLAAPVAVGAPPENYGQCVASGLEDPTTSQNGPGNLSPHTPTGLTGAPNANEQSGGASRFVFAHTCPKPS